MFCRDMERLNDGFGDKMATFIQWVSTFLGGYILGFAVGWKLTLVVMAGCPLMVLVAAFLGRVSGLEFLLEVIKFKSFFFSC